MATAARDDVDHQKHLDAAWDDKRSTLAARIQAVTGAEEAVDQGEPDALFVLRQALVDLASIAELVAAELPAPSRLGIRSARRDGGPRDNGAPD